MRLADPLVTVGVVVRNHPAGNRGPLPRAPGQRQWLAITVFGMCAALLTLVLEAGPAPHMPGQRILLAFVLCGPIMLLRRWPLPVLAVAVGANAWAVAAGNAPLGFGIILGLASYLAASQLPRRMSIPAVVASAAALGGALVYVELSVRVQTAPVAVGAVEGFLPLAAAWFIGDSVAARGRYLAGLAEQAERERAAEAERARQHVREERVRIARELHDVVAHTLAVITVQAGVGRRLMAKRPEQASTALESIETIGRTAQEELRVVLGLLRDEDGQSAGLAPAPRLVDVKELVETVRASGTPVDLRMSGIDRPLSPALELSVYRVVQEALTNVVKHAPGARAAVDLVVSDREVRLDVADDGGPAGRPGPGHGVGPGHGIVGMRERIGAFGGWLVAEPLAGCGFRVSAKVPIDGAA
jgi:signal transduction histidine kinase